MYTQLGYIYIIQLKYTVFVLVLSVAQTVLEVSVVDVDNDEHSSMMIMAKFGRATVTSKLATVLVRRHRLYQLLL